MKTTIRIVSFLITFPLSLFLTYREYLYFSDLGLVYKWPFNIEGLWIVWTFIQFILINIIFGFTIYRSSKSEIEEKRLYLEKEKQKLHNYLVKNDAEIKLNMENAKLEGIRFEVEPSKIDPGIFESKVGGIPFWPRNMEKLKSGLTSELKLLAQINLENLPKNEFLPQKGLLQFYLADDVFDREIDFKVIYHPEITSESVINDGNYKVSKDFPVKGIFKIYTFNHKYFYPDICNLNFEKIVGRKLTQEYLSGNDVALDYIYENFGIGEFESQMLIGGYSNPIQDELISENEILLLQIFSYADKQNLPDGYEIMWGDDGACYFTIDKQDLQKKDFSKVKFYWQTT